MNLVHSLDLVYRTLTEAMESLMAGLEILLLRPKVLFCPSDGAAILPRLATTEMEDLRVP